MAVRHKAHRRPAARQPDVCPQLRLHGAAPWGYHAFNLGIHLLCALLCSRCWVAMLRLPLGVRVGGWIGDKASLRRSRCCGWFTR